MFKKKMSLTIYRLCKIKKLELLQTLNIYEYQKSVYHVVEDELEHGEMRIKASKLKTFIVTV